MVKLDMEICKNSLAVGSNIISDLYYQTNLLYIVNRNLLDINYIVNVAKRRVRGMTLWGKIVNWFSYEPKKVIENKEQEIELQSIKNINKKNNNTNELLLELDKLYILSRNINILLVDSSNKINNIEANIIINNISEVEEMCKKN
jgi:thymidylate kinase